MEEEKKEKGQDNNSGTDNANKKTNSSDSSFLGKAIEKYRSNRRSKKGFDDDSGDTTNPDIDASPVKKNISNGKNGLERSIANKALNAGAKVSPTLRTLKTVNNIKNGINGVRTRRNMTGAAPSGGSVGGLLRDDNNDNKEVDRTNNVGDVTSSDNVVNEDSSSEGGNFLSSLLGGKKSKGLAGSFNIFGRFSIKSKIFSVILGVFVSLFIILLPVILIVLVFSPLLGQSEASANEGDVSYDAGQSAYYQRVEDVKKSYSEEEKEFSEIVITAAFTVLQVNVPSFTFADMTESRIREVADLMLEESENEDGTITYTAKGEDDVKEALAAYFKSIDSSLSDDTCKRMADDVFSYVEAYQEFTSDEEQSSNVASSCEGNSYWWPIGSIDTTTSNGVTFASGDPEPSSLTAYFAGADSVHRGNHGAIDISTSSGVGVTNVIAAQSGTVIYPTSDDQTRYDDNGSLNNSDGGGYGNYVIIEHSDGNYTYYAHMAKNSITVRAGDTVRQGQVIGKMGHSGRSTGAHLHFEVRVGGNTSANKVDPLDYVSIDDPRSGCADFSLTSTSLSKQEFISKMEAYCTSSGNSDFCTNFADHAAEIYDVSIDSGVNPELVVVTAGTEQNWAKCQDLYNYWGIDISNGQGCYDGPILRSLADGIREYASTLDNYQPGGSNAALIESRNQEREAAGCDPAGHGPPGTLAGMQSVYSWLGDYRYNPGDSGLGGCYYLNVMYGEDYCSRVPSGSDVPTTVCEQNDYTKWQIEKKVYLRKAIFGL